VISGLFLASGAARAQEVGGVTHDAGEEADEANATVSGDDASARDRFRRGTALFDAGDYEGAAREFEAAYDLGPELLFNVYLAHGLTWGLLPLGLGDDNTEVVSGPTGLTMRGRF
jgi:hypothetical protein